MTPPRKTKLYRKRMWAVIWPSTMPPFLFNWRSDATFEAEVMRSGGKGARVVRVEVRELPKAAGRGKGK